MANRIQKHSDRRQFERAMQRDREAVHAAERTCAAVSTLEVLARHDAERTAAVTERLRIGIAGIPSAPTGEVHDRFIRQELEPQLTAAQSSPGNSPTRARQRRICPQGHR